MKRKEIKQNPINRNKSHKAGTIRRRKGTKLRGAERGRGKETISRPVEISEKLISIQTDTAGCRGWVCVERGIGVGASDYLSENGWQKEMPEGSGKNACERETRAERPETQRGKDKCWRHGAGRVSDTERRAEPRAPLCLTLPQASSTAAFTLLVKQIRAATDSSAQHVC